MEKQLTHFGIPGMRWGRRKSSTDNQSISRSKGKSYLVERDSSGKEVARAQVTKKFADKFTIDKKTNDAIKKATGRNVPEGSVGERFAKALGMYKDKKGVWQAKPEAYVKAAAIGSGLGLASFFVEMKVRDFIAKRGVDTIVQSAEYANWLRNG